MILVLVFFLFVVLITVLVPCLVVIIFLNEISLREGKLHAGCMIVRIWSLLPRWLLIRLGGYGRHSPYYHRVTAAKSLPHLSAEMEGLNRFSLVSDELSTLAERLQAMDVVEKAKDLAKKHAGLAAEAIDAPPYSDDDVDAARISRRALVDLTNIVITRTN